ncbi:F1F0 ATP synthase subunit e, mitochondrial [Mycoemilia scoparia]|uniref:ATP synthase F(0) complex subunit e, mitochondrial n=1 Tax=Mycoemilia scoparia TaxID=417184 RepID=A0A9W8DTZ3_9FUNG|nr:F1F0 ATP synthase subunit e, mitochondrial [Mycoemilia scoparia]
MSAAAATTSGVRQVSSLFKVSRWAFFATGITYGFFHNRGLYKQAQEKRIADAYDRKVKLIEEAKKQYAALHAPKAAPAGGAVNWEDEKSVEVWFASLEK